MGLKNKPLKNVTMWCQVGKGEVAKAKKVTQAKEPEEEEMEEEKEIGGKGEEKERAKLATLVLQ